MIQVFVFKGVDYVGWDCFCKTLVTIGSAEEADLSLNHDGIYDIHAVLRVKDNRLLVSFNVSGTGDLSECRVVAPLDSLSIGPYNIKAKLSRNTKGTMRALHDSSGAAKVHKTSGPCRDEVKIGREGKSKFGEGHDESAEYENRGGENAAIVDPGATADVPEEDTASYNLVFEGHIRDDITIEDVKKNLEQMLRKDKGHIERLFSAKKAILKRNAGYRVVKELQSMLEITGALCHIEPVINQGIQTDAAPDTEPIEASHEQVVCCGPNTGPATSMPLSDDEDAPVDKSLAEVQIHNSSRLREEDDEDDDEDETQASFSLKDKIRSGSAVTASVGNRITGQEIILEIVKSRKDTIVDVYYLRALEKYFIRKEKGLFCLAENRGAGEFLLYLDDQTALVSDKKTHGRRGGNEASVHGEASPLESTMPIQERKISRYEEVVIHVEGYEYLLRQTFPSVSPQVKATPKRDKEYARHFGRSVVFHVVLLVILGMMPTYKPEMDIQDKGRFVQVDTRQIEEIRRKDKTTELPKKAPEVMKLKEERFAEKIDKSEINTPSAARKILNSQTLASRAVSSRSPDSGRGGGSGSGTGTGSGSGGGAGTGSGGPAGDGNVATRNVHKAGLLSMLGDNIGIKPQDAMAAVTNLDAVSSPAEGKANFKVGGIVGKIGGGKVEIPRAGIVSTKGSSQVLRTGGGTGGGGTGGPGGSGGTGGGGGGEMRVAALDKGSTGTHQVKAKVSAQLSKTVKVQGGGMSREEVKRIIDQHLDEITRCYETALVADPSLMGRVVFEWKILMSGKVGEVRIKSSTLNSTDIHSCIQSSIRSWEFPQPDGSEVVVSYPFIFDIVGF